MRKPVRTFQAYYEDVEFDDQASVVIEAKSQRAAVRIAYRMTDSIEEDALLDGRGLVLKCTSVEERVDKWVSFGFGSVKMLEAEVSRARRIAMRRKQAA